MITDRNNETEAIIWSAVGDVTDVDDVRAIPEKAGIPDFTVQDPGPRNIPADTNFPIDFFSLFISEDIITLMVTETNRYMFVKEIVL